MTALLRDRIKSAVLVASLHLLLGAALLHGLGVDVVRKAGSDLKLFKVPPELPPPLPPQAEPAARSDAPEGEAAPPNLKSQPVPVAVVPPEIHLPIPSPVTAAPIAGTGAQASAGAAQVTGPGTGAGGEGSGTGSGGRGSGPGSGGVAIKAQHIDGRIEDRDYPRTDAEGSVAVRFTVEASGRATGCRVMETSGDPLLDATTCRLIERRFRFRPARDAEGEAVPSESGWRQMWWRERG